MDFKQIQKLIKDFEKSSLKSLELEIEGLKLKLNKDGAELVESTTIPTSTPEPALKKGFEVKSPLVGTFLSAKSPQDKPFVAIGDKVEKGQTLCIIEAMKIINEITTPVSGVVEAIYADNGDAVGYDQVLMVIV